MWEEACVPKIETGHSTIGNIFSRTYNLVLEVVSDCCDLALNLINQNGHLLQMDKEMISDRMRG